MVGFSPCAAILALLLLAATVSAGEPGQEKPAVGKLAFEAAGKEFHFDTGVLRGTLRTQGRSLGLMPVFDVASGAKVSGAYGLFSPYRLLDAETRYGTAAWDWASQARLLPDGSVEAVWSADKDHPFDLKVVHAWKAPNTLDVATSVTPQKELRRFEVFLASYFEGFETPFVYVKGSPETDGKPGFIEAKRAAGEWQAFPRDAEAVKIIQDGRWKRPPNPVDWKILPTLAGPLAIRRDAKTGMAAVLMAPPGDCFAVLTPYSGETHRSIYLSLLGRDLRAGETATARARLVIGRAVSSEQAITLYEAYLKETH